mgnify:CR=1 FL=1
MSEITKEELLAMIEVQNKSASAMESIANSLRQVTEQNRVQAEVSREAVRVHAEEVKEAIKCQELNNKESREEYCKILSDGIKRTSDTHTEQLGISGKIKEDTGWLKIIIGSSTLIILIASVILQFVLGGVQTRKQIIDLENKIDRHMTQTGDK